MSRKYFSFVVLTVALLVVSLAGNVRASQLLMGDIFDGANSAATNGGINDNLSNRITGSDAASIIANSAWTPGANFYGTYAAKVMVNEVANPGQMDLYTGESSQGQLNTSHSFDATTDPSIAGTGFTVVVDWAPKYVASTTLTNWAYLCIGATTSTQSIWNRILLQRGTTTPSSWRRTGRSVRRHTGGIRRTRGPRPTIPPPTLRATCIGSNWTWRRLT